MTIAGRRVVAAGSLNDDTVIRLDSFPRAGETVLAPEARHESGGKSSNQAAAAALLGARVELYGVVGSDDAGRRLLADANARGVDVTKVRSQESASTGSAIVMVDAKGESSIIVSPGANGLFCDEDVPDSAFAGRPVVLLALESPFEAVARIAVRAHAAGAEVVLNASPAAALPPEVAASIDLLVVNEVEVELLSGVSPLTSRWHDVRDALAEIGIHRAIITLGADGAVVIDGREVSSLDAIPVVAVDTTGCGDAFMGGVAADLACGRSLLEAAHTGIAAGAWAAQTLGAQRSYGDRANLEALSSRAGAR